MTTEKLSKILDEKIEILMTIIKKVHFVTHRNEAMDVLMLEVEAIQKLNKSKMKSDVLFISAFEAYLKNKGVASVEALSSEDQKTFKDIQSQITKIEDLEQILGELMPAYEDRMKSVTARFNQASKISKAAAQYTRQNKPTK